MSHATCCLLSYERPKFLRTAISTLLQNADAPLELIVHDDGSHDPEVWSYLATLAHDGALSTLILNPPGHNQGQGTALNRMFGMATGDPIIKLDQDLVFHQPGWLARVQAILASNQSRSFPDGREEPEIGLLGLFHYLHDPVASEKCLVAKHKGWQEHTHICGSGFALTRRAWQQLGPFSEHSEAFAEDWEMQRRVTASEDFVCGLPDEDLVHNQGFGVGPSTVVVADGQVQKIHTEPVIHGAR